MDFDKLNLFIKLASKEYPILEKLDSLDVFKDKLKLCKKEFNKELGEGSSRVVFEFNKDQVLKLAKNTRGLAQNETEADLDLQKYDCIPKLYLYSEDYNYIVVEKVKKATEQSFKKILSVSFDEYCDNLEFEIEDDGEENSKLNKKSFVKEVVKIIKKFDAALGDFKKISSYGEKNGKLFVIDFGLTEEIYDKLYTRG